MRSQRLPKQRVGSHVKSLLDIKTFMDCGGGGFLSWGILLSLTYRQKAPVIPVTARHKIKQDKKIKNSPETDSMKKKKRKHLHCTPCEISLNWQNYYLITIGCIPLWGVKHLGAVGWLKQWRLNPFSLILMENVIRSRKDVKQKSWGQPLC